MCSAECQKHWQPHRTSVSGKQTVVASLVFQGVGQLIQNKQIMLLDLPFFFYSFKNILLSVFLYEC